MRNLRLTLAYDGTNYVGWQVQPNGLSVQTVVEEAIRRLTGETVRLMVAGRTDARVHALGQVANFVTRTSIPCDGFLAGLNRFLPDDVCVRETAEVPEDFHATFSARRKRYRYVWYNHRVRDPFMRNYAWHYGGRLDAAAMHEAAQVLLGTHDFRCFESHFPNKATSVRTVMEATVDRHDGWPVWTRPELPRQPPTPIGPLEKGTGSRHIDKASTNVEESEGASPLFQRAAGGDFIWLDIVADGFLYNMVRAIAGTLLKVGRHRWTAQTVRRIVERRDRALAGDTAPPQGLYLVRVDYE